MALLWQQIIVGGALLVAGTYLVVYFYRRRKAKTGCQSCPALEAMASKQSSPEKTSSV